MRLFIAIELPEAERRRMNAYRGRYEWFGIDAPLRWVRPENMHLTLKFLGEVEDARAAQVAEALKGVAWPRSLALREEGVTYFPLRGRASVLVALVGGDVEPLRALHGQVEAALEPLGFARESRPYAPHVTLARVGRGRQRPGRGLLKNRPPEPPEPFAVDSFVLFESRLKPEGAEHVALARFGG